MKKPWQDKKVTAKQKSHDKNKKATAKKKKRKNSKMTHFKGATKSYRKIIFVSATKISENTTNILNCYFSS